MYVLTGATPTERLTLRRFREDDLEDVVDMESREDVVRYLYWQVWDREVMRERLTQRIAMDGLRAEGDAMLVAVERRDTPGVIGHVMLRWSSVEHRQGEIGFVFHPDHQRNGYATEAAAVVLRIAFADVGLHRVCGRADARNEASIRLMRRLGMRHEAHLVQNEHIKGEWCDEVVLAILGSEWAHSQRGLVGDARPAR